MLCLSRRYDFLSFKQIKYSSCCCREKQVWATHLRDARPVCFPRDIHALGCFSRRKQKILGRESKETRSQSDGHHRSLPARFQVTEPGIFLVFSIFLSFLFILKERKRERETKLIIFREASCRDGAHTHYISRSNRPTKEMGNGKEE